MTLRRRMDAGNGRRLLSVSGRMKIVAAVAVALLAVGVVAADGALGTHDTQTGTGALSAEAGGDFNTADGYTTLHSNTTGTYNTATGFESLSANVTGSINTADGEDALLSNINGSSNTAVGDESLYGNTSGGYNTGAGQDTLFSNTAGYDNSALGAYALNSNTTGGHNTAAGENSMFASTTGDDNTAIGDSAGSGDHPSTTGSQNTFLGYSASQGTDTEIDNATAIGANATVSESDAVALGDSTAKVGIGNAVPQSRLQIGSGASSSWGDYLQLPVVTNTSKTPPSGDCNSTTLVGRMVLQQVKKKLVLWGCSSAGVWVKL